MKVGQKKPTKGEEFESSALAKALKRQLEFSKHEWLAFGVDSALSYDSYIKVDNQYYKPAPPEYKLDNEGVCEKPEALPEGAFVLPTEDFCAISTSREFLHDLLPPPCPPGDRKTRVRQAQGTRGRDLPEYIIIACRCSGVSRTRLYPRLAA